MNGAFDLEEPARALAALERGETIVFPTETFYGLGADALNAAAVARLVEIKGRDPANPIPLIIADRKMLTAIAREVSPVADRLARAFWPGPLTLVLPAKPGLPAPLVNSAGEIGVRISSHPLAARLARELGRPITATSANPAGRAPARAVEEARGYFAGKIEIYLDGGRLGAPKGSTVVGVVGTAPQLIRDGAIPFAEIEAALARDR